MERLFLRHTTHRREREKREVATEVKDVYVVASQRRRGNSAAAPKAPEKKNKEKSGSDERAEEKARAG
jgi:uncharacterized protein (UPF0335 family)